MTRAEGMWGTPRQWAIDLAVATGIGAFLGVIGPFGSFNGGPLIDRLFFWITDFWIGFIALSIAVRLSLRAASRFDLPDWFSVAVGVALGAAPLSLALGCYSARFWPGNNAHMGPFLELYGQTLAISEPCAFGFYFLLDGRLRRSPRPAAAPPSAPTPSGAGASARFLDRLPARLGRNLLCLQMEDHYVRAHTDRGSELILTPLKDAIDELAEIDGAHVHRSWWVARNAVAEAIVDGRKHVLRLTNGLEAPVARASVAKLRAMGWLRAP